MPGSGMIGWRISLSRSQGMRIARSPRKMDLMKPTWRDMGRRTIDVRDLTIWEIEVSFSVSSESHFIKRPAGPQSRSGYPLAPLWPAPRCQYIARFTLRTWDSDSVSATIRSSVTAPPWHQPARPGRGPVTDLTLMAAVERHCHPQLRSRIELQWAGRNLQRVRP